MKFLETHFEEYIEEVERCNLHVKIEDKVWSLLPENIESFKNLIFYGPSGVGKYSQMLYAIKKYSPSELKYEKKIIITYDSKQYYFKISDIHYEIDMALLGCNSKMLWHEIFQQIVDALNIKTVKTGIIVCKNFHFIHSELLENFYSYMQDNNASVVSIKYILLTEEISFIPDAILNCCETITLARPAKTNYAKCIQQKLLNDFQPEEVLNIKYLKSGNTMLNTPYKIICDKIVREILDIDKLKFLKFRDLLYDLFIYNLDVTTCVWYILVSLTKTQHLNETNMSLVLLKTYSCLKYFNNNYRPIYHLESFLFYLVSIIHQF
jgi:hypothetical protein